MKRFLVPAILTAGGAVGIGIAGFIRSGTQELCALQINGCVSYYSLFRHSVSADTFFGIRSATHFLFIAGLLAASLGILMILVRLLRPKFEVAGICRTCGYDLRATVERCPECGAVPNRKAVIASTEPAIKWNRCANVGSRDDDVIVLGRAEQSRHT